MLVVKKRSKVVWVIFIFIEKEIKLFGWLFEIIGVDSFSSVE